GIQHVESLGIDPNHNDRLGAGVVPQGGHVIVVHMLEDSRFLRRGERILQDELIRFNPVNPAESADESHADEIEAEKFEVVRPCILSGLWKAAEVALANIVLMRAERACVCNTGKAPS